MFGSVLVSAVTLTHIYVFWRAGSVPALKRRFSREIIIGTGLALRTAIAADMGASLLVIFNAHRLLNPKHKAAQLPIQVEEGIEASSWHMGDRLL